MKNHYVLILTFIIVILTACKSDEDKINYIVPIQAENLAVDIEEALNNYDADFLKDNFNINSFTKKISFKKIPKHTRSSVVYFLRRLVRDALGSIAETNKLNNQKTELIELYEKDNAVRAIYSISDSTGTSADNVVFYLQPNNQGDYYIANHYHVASGYSISQLIQSALSMQVDVPLGKQLEMMDAYQTLAEARHQLNSGNPDGALDLVREIKSPYSNYVILRSGIIQVLLLIDNNELIYEKLNYEIEFNPNEVSKKYYLYYLSLLNDQDRDDLSEEQLDALTDYSEVLFTH